MLHSLSVVIAAYNEEKTLAGVVDGINRALSDLVNRYEIIIIDDGSRDRTGIIAENLSEQNDRIRVIRHADNLGFGAVQKTGYSNANYEYIMLVPADGQFDIREFPKILASVEDNDILIGGKKDYYKHPFQLRTIKSKCYNLALRILFGLKFYDTQWVKVIRRSLLEKLTLESKSAFIDAEILIKALRIGGKVKEMTVSYFPRSSGVSKAGRISVSFMTMIELLNYWIKSRRTNLKDYRTPQAENSQTKAER